MKVEFECIVCGETASATVDDDVTTTEGEPLKTLRECPNCSIETIWMES